MIVVVAAGAIVRLAAPEFAKTLDPVGKGFVLPIKMMITPVIFILIVIGVGSIAKAATVGKIGGLAVGHFLIMSTFALGIGLVVGNLLHPGTGLNIATSTAVGEPLSGTDFILGIIPEMLFSSFASGSILQVLLVALLVGFALQGHGDNHASILEAVKKLQALVFRILSMVLRLAPIGAFGAITAVVGNTGGGALPSLATLVVGFYIACAVFIIVILGTLLRVVTGVNIFSPMKYLGREYPLIVGTSSSEAALPRLISTMEHLGVSKSVVGITSRAPCASPERD